MPFMPYTYLAFMYLHLLNAADFLKIYHLAFINISDIFYSIIFYIVIIFRIKMICDLSIIML